jgi:hypothetical protein
VRARPAGRLVVVTLAADEVTAVGALHRAEAAAADIPCTLVLAAPRGPAWDHVLVERDAVLVHGADDLLVALAVDRLLDAGANASRLEPPPGVAVRALATTGVALPGLLRPMRSALRELA